MSIEAENVDHQNEVETDNEKIIKLLSAILNGIAIIADTEPESLIGNVEGM